MKTTHHSPVKFPLSFYGGFLSFYGDLYVSSTHTNNKIPNVSVKMENPTTLLFLIPFTSRTNELLWTQMSVQEFAPSSTVMDLLERTGRGSPRWSHYNFPLKEELRPRLNQEPVSDPNQKLRMGDVVELSPSIPDETLTEYREEIQRMYDRGLSLSSPDGRHRWLSFCQCSTPNLKSIDSNVHTCVIKMYELYSYWLRSEWNLMGEGRCIKYCLQYIM